MRRLFTFLFIIVLFNLYLSEALQAIECKNAKTQDEKIICSSDTLKNYDAALSKIYDAILKDLRDEGKKKLITEQNAWLLKRGQKQDESALLVMYVERVRGLCRQNENKCKMLANLSMKNLDEQFKADLKKMHYITDANKFTYTTDNIYGHDKKSVNDNATQNVIDSIIVASYLKGNMNRYIQDKKALAEIEDDIRLSDNRISLDEVSLEYEDNTIQLILPLFMGAYQGQSMSFGYENNTFRALSLPKFEEGRLNDSYTHSNYYQWFKDEFIVHDRSQGYLYECGDTEYYKFEQGRFRLVEQTRTECTEQELEAIEKGKLTPEDIKNAVVYPRKKMDE